MSQAWELPTDDSICWSDDEPAVHSQEVNMSQDWELPADGSCWSDDESFIWTGDRLNGITLEVFDNGGVWVITKFIQERITWYPIRPGEHCELTSVHEAELVVGPTTKTKERTGIVKMCWQLPTKYFFEGLGDHDPTELLTSAPGQMSQHYDRFKRLERAGCRGVPRALAVEEQAQEGPRCWLPGGYLSMLLMTKVPGRTLEDIVENDHPPEEELAQIRKALRKSLEELIKNSVCYVDRRPSNALYDKETGICYLIDPEGMSDIDPGAPLTWDFWESDSTYDAFGVPLPQAQQVNNIEPVKQTQSVPVQWTDW